MLMFLRKDFHNVLLHNYKLTIDITVAACPITIKVSLALVNATFILLASLRNPIPPLYDDRTHENITKSFSYPYIY